jgi:hypothetical protein
MANYAVLFRLSVRHHYFSDNQCKPLTFTLCPQTQKMMHNCDLLHRVDGSACSILFNCENTSALSATANDKQLKFNIKITVKDDQFGYYSKEKVWINNTRMTLGVDNADFKGADSKGESQEQAVTQTYLDTPALAKLTERQFTEPMLNNQFVAAMHLSPAQLSQLLSSQSTPWALVLQLSALQTRWQYYFVGQWFEQLFDQPSHEPGEQPAQIQITDVAGKVLFSVLAPVELGNGIRAISAISDQPLAMQQVSEQHFQLCRGEQVLVAHLPVANIFQQNRRDNLPVSEIYVNQSKRIN